MFKSIIKTQLSPYVNEIDNDSILVSDSNFVGRGGLNTEFCQETILGEFKLTIN